MTKLNTDPIFVADMQGCSCIFAHCSTAAIYFANWLHQALISNKNIPPQIMNSMCFFVSTGNLFWQQLILSTDKQSSELQTSD